MSFGFLGDGFGFRGVLFDFSLELPGFLDVALGFTGVAFGFIDGAFDFTDERAGPAIVELGLRVAGTRVFGALLVEPSVLEVTP